MLQPSRALCRVYVQGKESSLSHTTCNTFVVLTLNTHACTRGESTTIWPRTFNYEDHMPATPTVFLSHIMHQIRNVTRLVRCMHTYIHIFWCASTQITTHTHTHTHTHTVMSKDGPTLRPPPAAQQSPSLFCGRTPSSCREQPRASAGPNQGRSECGPWSPGHRKPTCACVRGVTLCDMCWCGLVAGHKNSMAGCFFVDVGDVCLCSESILHRMSWIDSNKYTGWLHIFVRPCFFWMCACMHVCTYEWMHVC
jgi:hypothetical protein